MDSPPPGCLSLLTQANKRGYRIGYSKQRWISSDWTNITAAPGIQAGALTLCISEAIPLLQHSVVTKAFPLITVVSSHPLDSYWTCGNSPLRLSGSVLAGISTNATQHWIEISAKHMPSIVSTESHDWLHHPMLTPFLMSALQHFYCSQAGSQIWIFWFLSADCLHLIEANS